MLARSVVLPALLALLPGCFGVPSGDPCQDYCDYICTCHEGEEEFDCDQCLAEYASSDPELQDECETELVALQTQDQADNTGCFEEEGEDTGAF